jgi:hypothetical protein
MLVHSPILLPSSDKHSSSTGSEKKFITKKMVEDGKSGKKGKKQHHIREAS